MKSKKKRNECLSNNFEILPEMDILEKNMSYHDFTQKDLNVPITIKEIKLLFFSPEKARLYFISNFCQLSWKRASNFIQYFLNN